MTNIKEALSTLIEQVTADILSEMRRKNQDRAKARALEEILDGWIDLQVDQDNISYLENCVARTLVEYALRLSHQAGHFQREVEGEDEDDDLLMDEGRAA
jgi:hypothetical protein